MGVLQGPVKLIHDCAWCGKSISPFEREMYRALRTPDGQLVRAFWHYGCFEQDHLYGYIVSACRAPGEVESAFKRIAQRGYSRVDVTHKPAA